MGVPVDGRGMVVVGSNGGSVGVVPGGTVLGGTVVFGTVGTIAGEVVEVVPPEGGRVVDVVAPSAVGGVRPAVEAVPEPAPGRVTAVVAGAASTVAGANGLGRRPIALSTAAATSGNEVS